MSTEIRPIKTLILEDVLTLAETTKGVFESQPGIEVQPGIRRKLECLIYTSLGALANREAEEQIADCELAIIDLGLPEGRLAGASVFVVDSRFLSPNMRKVVYTGMPGATLDSQEWLDVCVEMMWLGAWDFVMKTSDAWKGMKISSVQYLYNRIAEKWEHEERDHRQMEAARTLSREIRKQRKTKWEGKYVGFWASQDGKEVHPNPEELSQGDGAQMVGATYLEVMTKYIKLRENAPDGGKGMPEFPFITFIDILSKEEQ